MVAHKGSSPVEPKYGLGGTVLLKSVLGARDTRGSYVAYHDEPPFHQPPPNKNGIHVHRVYNSTKTPKGEMSHYHLKHQRHKRRALVDPPRHSNR